jgi:hypothetical protein
MFGNLGGIAIHLETMSWLFNTHRQKVYNLIAAIFAMLGKFSYLGCYNAILFRALQLWPLKC